VTLQYVGSELALFARATNWKRYVARCLAPYVSGRVLDVGAGIGSNIPPLFSPEVREWVALEPDPALAGKISEAIAAGALSDTCSVINGDIEAIPAGTAFDTILYIDVLEHVADDDAELRRATLRLAPSGRLAVLVPAHQFLFSPFDAAVGHHRRYTVAALRAITPTGMRLECCRMLDSIGFLASLANRILLQSAQPTSVSGDMQNPSGGDIRNPSTLRSRGETRWLTM
jgi:2-polyprenyl-3-methyl-5-hydroxy-6-metoxy-1,4-benzoquinol methylase